MRYILSIAVTILAATSMHGQANTPQTGQCTLKIGQAPAIRGVKLGMKVDEVLTMFPGSSENVYIRNSLLENPNYPKFGVIHFGVSPNQFGGKERFVGIGSFYFTFVDGRMISYGLEYDRPPWPRLEDFVNKIASAFQLPQAKNWAIENGHWNLTCDGFRVEAMTRDGRGAVLVTTGENADKIARERRAAAEEKERQEFKP